MAGGKLWTAEEDKILEEEYSKFSPISKIQEKIGRSKGSITTRAEYLGLPQKYIRNNSCNYKAKYQKYDWCYDKYIVHGMDMKDMAKECGCSLRTIQKWCTEVHGLSNKTFREYYELTPIQRSIILAGTLGDGHITRSNTQTVYIESHAEDEKDYIFWKYSMLKELCVSEPSFYPQRVKLIYGKEYLVQNFYRLSTRCANCLQEIRDLSKCERIAQLDELGLCLHMLDDGNRDCKNWRICFGDWEICESKFYIDHLSEKFGIEARLCKDVRYAVVTSKSSRYIDKMILNNLPNNLDIINKKIVCKSRRSI